ncbi:hypothetical protein P4J62_25715, partial [Bacillus cereus]|nr:hypothetical protein [Bacillus cereus]
GPVGPVAPLIPVGPVGPVAPLIPVGRVNEEIGGNVGPIKLESSESADGFLKFNPSHFFFLSIYLTPN